MLGVEPMYGSPTVRDDVYAKLPTLTFSLLSNGFAAGLEMVSSDV